MSLLENYEKTFDIVVKEFTGDSEMCKEIPQVLQRLEKLLRYTVPYGQKWRGYLVPWVFTEIGGKAVTEETIKQAHVLGWCMQMLQTFLTIIDDILDDGDKRFGKPSWYYFNKKEKICINDCCLFQQAIYRLLAKYFAASRPILYGKLVAFFSDVLYIYLLGESLEIQELGNVESYTMERCKVFSKYTNSHGRAFSGAFNLAIMLAELDEQDRYVDLQKQINKIGHDIAYMWMVKDDMIDSSVFDGIPNSEPDIRFGKSTWIFVKAREMASAEQWNILKEHYGKDNDQSVETVNKIYTQLGVVDICKSHLKELFDKVNGDIETISGHESGIGKPLLELLYGFASVDDRIENSRDGFPRSESFE